MRQQRFSKFIAVSALALAATYSAALEFRAIAEHGAVFYDSPSDGGKKLFVVSKGYPVEVLIDKGDWLRVRDQSGALAWVTKKSLSARRTVVVTVAKAEVHAAADAAAPTLFLADKSVVFELVDAGKTGWAKIRHRDGAVGFIHVNEVWGI
jgi:SH3-like domain-containing protein